MLQKICFSPVIFSVNHRRLAAAAAAAAAVAVVAFVAVAAV